MKTKVSLLLTAIALAVTLSGCASLPPFEGPFAAEGRWNYTLTDTNDNTYDSGTITFSGQGTTGTWEQDNYYHVIYRGSWKLEGLKLSLSGSETWTGTATGPNSLSGTWAHTDASGTWKATR